MTEHDFPKQTENHAPKFIERMVFLTIALEEAASIVTLYYLVSLINIGSIRPEVDNNLIGLKFDTYTVGTNCHIGLHPTGNNKDVHAICMSGNGLPLIIIIPNAIP